MTPGEEFDDDILRLIQAIKGALAVAAFVATGLLVLYATYLILGSLIFLIHASLR